MQKVEQINEFWCVLAINWYPDLDFLTVRKSESRVRQTESRFACISIGEVARATRVEISCYFNLNRTPIQTNAFARLNFPDDFSPAIRQAIEYSLYQPFFNI